MYCPNALTRHFHTSRPLLGLLGSCPGVDMKELKVFMGRGVE
jgi:hypothetical protein